MPFVVGDGRSGTTLLRLMLDAHPQLAIPSETHFAPKLIEAMSRRQIGPREAVDLIAQTKRWPDFGLDRDQLEARFRAAPSFDPATALRAFYGLYAERQGKPRWGDKTPLYVRWMPLLERTLPEVSFVHVIRDGRDVALSVRERSLKQRDVRELALRWQRRIRRARRQAPRLRSYTEVRYEDLIDDTEATLRRVAEFVALEWDPAMLSYHERAGDRLQEIARDLPARGGGAHRPAAQRLSVHARTQRPPDPTRVQRWRTQMSAEDVAEFEAAAGDLLGELGYERAGG